MTVEITQVKQAEYRLEQPSVMILGAGFSAAATEGRLPVMSNFFVGICRNTYPLLVSFLDDSFGDAESANVEKALLLLEQIEHATDRALAPTEQSWRSSCRGIKSELSGFVLDRLRPCVEIEDTNWAANLLADLSPGPTIISMNYDNLAERVLSSRAHRTQQLRLRCPHCKMCRLLEAACSCSGRGALTYKQWNGALLKPHGSIAWKRCCNADCCSYECLVADRHCRPFDNCECTDCGTSCEPVLVLPSMAKRLEEIPEIAVMWEATRAALNSAKSLILFGFSLPLSDSLLTHAVARALRESAHLTHIWIIDLDPQAVAQRLVEVTPPARRLTITLLPVDRKCDPIWLAPAIGA